MQTATKIKVKTSTKVGLILAAGAAAAAVAFGLLRPVPPAPRLPDLTTGMDIYDSAGNWVPTGATLTPNTLVKTVFNVRNVGSASASPSILELTVFDLTLSPQVLVNRQTRFVPLLGPGASTGALSIPLTINPAWAGHALGISFFVDKNNTVVESNERNNTGGTSQFVSRTGTATGTPRNR